MELAGNRQFNEIWNIPPYEDHYRQSDGFISPELAKKGLFKRMTDCEIVLRFFAFRRRSRIKGAARKILDKCMEEYHEADEAAIDDLRQRFPKGTRCCQQDFRLTEVFQVKNESGTWRHSQPLFDATMVAIDTLGEESEELVHSAAQIRKQLALVLENEDVYEIIVGRPNTAKAVKDRIDEISNLFLGVSLMAGTQVFASAIQELETTLGELDESIVFVDASASLRPRLGKSIAWAVIDESEKLLLGKFYGPFVNFFSKHSLRLGHCNLRRVRKLHPSNYT